MKPRLFCTRVIGSKTYKEMIQIQSNEAKMIRQRSAMQMNNNSKCIVKPIQVFLKTNRWDGFKWASHSSDFSRVWFLVIKYKNICTITFEHVKIQNIVACNS